MSREKISVFLADDHAMVREALAALLNRHDDIEVVGQCGHGLKVTEQIVAINPNVAILDIGMPGLNGLDVCKQLSVKAKDVVVIILTMHDDGQFIARAKEYGAAAYLLKESAADGLCEAVRTASHGRFHLDPGISKALAGHKISENDPYEQLTARERQVFQLIAEGKTNRKIAEILTLSVKTVDTHRAHLMRKLDIHDQTSLVKIAIQKGVIQVNRIR